MPERGAYEEPRSKSGRFLPPDPKVREPYRLTPSLALRVGILGALALLVFGILFFRLWSLQVLSGENYLTAAQNNQIRLIREEAPRGPILDRDGRVIVGNVAGTAVQLWVGDMPRALGRRREIVRRLAAVLDVPPRELARDVAARASDPLTPITVKTAVHEAQVNYLYEHRAEFPGVRIVQTYLRDYAYGALAAQILGYVGEISPEELKGLRTRRAIAAATGSARRGSRPRTTRSSGAATASARSASTRWGGRSARTCRRRRRGPGSRSASRSTCSSSGQPSRRSCTGSISHIRTATGRPTVARSSPSTRATARSSQWRRTRPTSRRSTSAASIPRSSRRSSTTRRLSTPTTPA